MDSENIDILQLLRMLRKRLWVIVLLAFMGISLSGVYTFFVVDEVYRANVLVYIWQDRSLGENQNVSSADLALFSQLVGDYQVLAKSRLVTRIVAEELDLDPVSADRLPGQIMVGTASNTRHLTIAVTDTDPIFAATVANKVADVFAQVVVDKMGAGNVNIIDPAVVPSAPASPNKRLNLAIGLLLGVMSGIGLALLIEFLDTSVRTIEDVAAITDYTLLGTIPEFEHNLNPGERRR